jgi:hypothetical protein
MANPNEKVYGPFQDEGKRYSPGTVQKYAFPGEAAQQYFIINETDWQDYAKGTIDRVQSTLNTISPGFTPGQQTTNENTETSLRELASRINQGTFNINLTTTGNIRLPLPLSLTDTFNVSFNSDFSIIERFAGGLLNVGNAIAQPGGYLFNSYKTVVLEQPQYRRIPLSWKLSPRNYQESVEIQKILYRLRKGMTPKRTASNRAILKFPNIYTLAFQPNPQFLFKFKPCVIESIVVDFNAGQPIPAFYNGDAGNPPESVMVSAVFLELEYWLDGEGGLSDYRDGGDDLPTPDPFDTFHAYSVR